MTDAVQVEPIAVSTTIRPPSHNLKNLTPERLEALLQISLHLSQARDLPQLAEEALRRALDFSDCESGSIMLLTEDGSRLRIVAAVGLAPEVGDRYYPAHAGVTGIAMNARQPVFLRGNDMNVDVKGKRSSAASREEAPSVCVPLITPQQHVLGTLNLTPSRTPLTSSRRIRPSWTRWLGSWPSCSKT
ncbi:MAG: GAF domain-containing protein [Chloroflexi bacterium]|nr:GAF domain-containing protein [Chloroflexota bacterium]